MFLVEEFSPNHLAAVVDIAARTLREHYAPEFFLTMHDLLPELFLVARAFYSPEPVGFLAAARGSPGEARLLLLAVRPGFQSQGIGRMLLNEFVRRCARLGVREVILEVRQSNLAAIRFYRAAGFDLAGSVDGFYADGEAAFVMRRALA